MKNIGETLNRTQRVATFGSQIRGGVVQHLGRRSLRSVAAGARNVAPIKSPPLGISRVRSGSPCTGVSSVSGPLIQLRRSFINHSRGLAKRFGQSIGLAPLATRDE
uniref:Uncharacterized protein n=1 Tax=Anopheles atroparvus TaxID=41427 RepID=A0A182IUP4_ANOAO